MKRYLAILLFAASTANAQFLSPNAAAVSGAQAGASAGAASDAAAGASANSLNLQGNAQSIHFNSPGDVRNSVHYDGRYDVKSVPNVISPNILPSAVCHGSTSAGISVLGLGLGGGSSWQDSDCQYRETARVFQGLGMTADAVAILCSSGFAANAPSCKALAPKPAPQPRADTGTKVGEPGQPGGGDRSRAAADAEFCNRPEVKADKILLERNGCVTVAVKK